jgi:hypothetical protein
MGINGVSTRKVAAITEELCGTYSLHRLFLPSTRGWTLSSIAGTSRHFYTKNLDCSGKERYIKKTSRTSLAEVLLSSQFIFSRSLVFDMAVGDYHSTWFKIKTGALDGSCFPGSGGLNDYHRWFAPAYYIIIR